jgi:hypothetical protein
MTNIYYIHDNGGRPFKVEIDNNKNSVTVFNNIEDSKNYKKNIYSSKYTNIWIGKSPKIEMTEYSGGYGKKFVGNTILIETGDLEYVFIGEEILSFKSISPIKKYISPVGNNDVPYPYAIDNEGYIYLLIENVIVHPNEKTQPLFNKSEEPYTVYYKLGKISESIIKLRKDEFDYNIKNLVVGDEIKMEKRELVHVVHVGSKKKSNKSKGTKTKKASKSPRLMNITTNVYSFSYSENPEEDYERMRRFNKKSGESLYIQTSDNKLIKLSKKEYVTIMEKWGNIFGIQKLIEPKVIVKRFGL